MKGRRGAVAVQHTLRNVPAVVDHALRREAALESKSLNEVALAALTLGAGVKPEACERHDLDFPFGSWVHDSAVDRALEEQRAIDEDVWKCGSHSTRYV
jgi:hypothetical protein